MVENLLTQLELKLGAEAAGIESITIQNEQINLGYPEGKALPQPWEFDLKVRFGESSVWVPLDLMAKDWLKRLLTILEGLTAF